MATLLKAGGLLQGVTACELTVKDVYQLKIFSPRVGSTICPGQDSTFCQLLGERKMMLPGYNTVQPKAGMYE